MDEYNYWGDRRVLAAMRDRGWAIIASSAQRGSRVLVQFGDELAEEIIDSGLRPEDWDGKQECICTREVCPLCDGRGTVCNPAIDAGGITDWSDWDQDDRERYWSGYYDITCPECRGRNVVEVPQFDAEIQKVIDAWQDAEADYARVCAFERRYGA